LISDEIDGPFCWQLHEPTIVLPKFLLQGSREDLRNVFRHELEHLKTNHPLQLFLQNVAQVICWFHPAVWRAAARASLMRECACDDAAAGDGANTAAYLRTLLRIAEFAERMGNRSTISFARMPSEIVLRARRLVNLANNESFHERSSLRKNTAMCALVAIILAMCLVSIPCNSLASSRSKWSPWPTWTAQAAHCFGIRLRDYESFDRRSQLFEIIRNTNACSNVVLSGADPNQSDL
jgi:beta-lactamase regulating signal transducer with metallopeptidase domain